MGFLTSILGGIITQVLKMAALIGLGSSMTANKALKKTLSNVKKRNEIEKNLPKLSSGERVKWLRRR
jgi:hypothetical protein